MMRIVDIIYSIPYILLVVVLLNVFGGQNTKFLIGWLPHIIAAIVLMIGVTNMFNRLNATTRQIAGAWG